MTVYRQFWARRNALSWIWRTCKIKKEVHWNNWHKTQQQLGMKCKRLCHYMTEQAMKSNSSWTLYRKGRNCSNLPRAYSSESQHTCHPWVPIMMVASRCQSGVEIKKKEVERETEEILVGQNKLSQRRRIVRDLQAQLLEIQESKKAAVTGNPFLYVVWCQCMVWQ